jgi:hypothetical protein
MGVLDGMLAMLTRDADLEWLMIDSSIVRAHEHAGARQSKGGGCQGLGPSRGGMSTKMICAAGDTLSLPVRFIAGPGQRNDVAFAHELIDGFQPDATIAAPFVAVATGKAAPKRSIQLPLERMGPRSQSHLNP